MVTIDIGLIVASVTLLGTAITVLRWAIRINRRFETLERHDKLDFEARRVLLEGVHASLDGLKQLGANGHVTEAEKKLKQFMVNH